VLAVAPLFLISCGERERNNPLDPLNESTRGAPPGFRAVALDERVELRWTPVRFDDLIGYNVYRAQSESGAFVTLAGSPYSSMSGEITDSLVTNGTTYYYYLVPLVRSYGEAIPSPTVPATPGSDFAVATGPETGVVTKLSADLTAPIWTLGGFYYPFASATDGQKIWVTDLYGAVMCLSGDGEVLWTNDQFLLPVAVSVRHDGLAAVVDRQGGTLSVLSPEGGVQVSVSLPLTAPTSVSFSTDDAIWVADPGAGLVNKYSLDGHLLHSYEGCAQPSFLDGQTVDGSCWVIDAATNHVVKLSPEAVEVVRVTLLSKPVVLSPDVSGDGCWVSDSGTEEIVRLADDGRVLFRVGKVGRVLAIQVLSPEGSAWLADANGDRIFVLSPSGRIASFATIPFSPASLTVLQAAH